MKNENQDKKILIIIPAYNEERNLPKVIGTINRLTFDTDYIIINDCSKDGTIKLCVDNGYKFVSLPVNLGIGGAMQTGYMFAYNNGYDIAIQVDGDGQHDANQLNELIEPILSGKTDMVIGSRYLKKDGFQSTLMRRLGINILSLLVYFRCKVRIKDVTSGFRAVNSAIISQFARSYPTDYPEPESLSSAIKSGYRVCEVPVIMRAREFGKSSINPVKSIYYMVKVSMAILFSERYR